MKVTVSSTSMMKPILYTQTSEQAKQRHPQRIVGLLEGIDRGKVDEPVMTYSHPHQSLHDALPVHRQCFLHIPDARAQPCVAVFGFQFDGKNNWYQAWNQTAEHVCWLLQEEGLEYKPYAIMAMDALVTLLPNWNREIVLNLSLNNASSKQVDPATPSFLAPGRDYDLLISDAATTATGKLWFLVNVKDEYAGMCEQIRSGELRTGWISQNQSTALAA